MKINKVEQLDDDSDRAKYEHLPQYYSRVSRLEVFSVRIDTSDEDDDNPPADIYGTISVHDPYSSTDPNIHFEIFNRKKGDYDSFLPGIDTQLLLTGPPPASFIDVYYELSIYLALFNNDYDEDSLPGSPFPYTAIDITESFMYWGPSFGWMSYTIEHNKILSRKLFGEFGSVTVDCIIFGNSVAALLEITLLSTRDNVDNDGGVEVCGRVIARNSVYEEYESLLFRRHKGVHVKHGELIPLSRSKIAAPFESSLVIEVDFWGHEEDVSIAKGGVQFHLTELTGTYEKIVCGEQGEVLVRITWWADEVKAYRNDPSKFAVAVAPLAVVASSEPAPAASKEEEKTDELAEKSDVDDDMGFSLFD